MSWIILGAFGAWVWLDGREQLRSLRRLNRRLKRLLGKVRNG